MVLLSSLNTCLILVRKIYVVGTQKNHLTEMVPPSTQKYMPNIGEKNIPIYVKAKQTRNKSKIKVKQSKAGKKKGVKNYISKSKIKLINFCTLNICTMSRSSSCVDQPLELLKIFDFAKIIREAVPHTSCLVAKRRFTVLCGTHSWYIYKVVISERVNRIFL